jgi:ribonuclease D
MDTNTPASTASDSEAALVGQIREVAVQAAELAACLALRGSRIAATAAPSQTTLADLAAMGRSVADQARSTSQAILLLTTLATSPAAQPATTETVKLLRHADEWTTMLDRQIKTAVEIHALICSELSDRAAIAEEWNAEPNQQLRSPYAARTLATHARTLRDSVAS